MKKITLGLLALSILITGCSTENNDKNVDKVSNNIGKSLEQEQIKDKENQVNKEQKDKIEVKLDSKFHHNRDEAKKLVNDIISFQVNSFDIQKSQFERTMPSGFATLPTLSTDVRKINLANMGAINIIKLSEVVDVYNTYNKNTYNEEDVLKDVKTVLKANNLVFYSEVAEKSSDKSDGELKKQLEKMGSVVYFKGDKTFAYNLPFGLGGAGFPQAAPESDWIEDGDSLEIPVVSPIDKTIVNRIVVKINNKDYSGGSKKSYYYYYDVK